jgi:hypothetical protein
MNYDELEDKEIFERLENSRFAEVLNNSAEWGIVRTAFERLKKKKDYIFMMSDPKSTDEIVCLYYAHREFLRTGTDLPSFINYLRREGSMVFSEAKERGIITPPMA